MHDVARYAVLKLKPGNFSSNYKFVPIVKCRDEILTIQRLGALLSYDTVRLSMHFVKTNFILFFLNRFTLSVPQGFDRSPIS